MRIPPKADVELRNSLQDIHQKIAELERQISGVNQAPPEVKPERRTEVETFRDLLVKGNLRVDGDITFGGLSGPEIGGLVGEADHGTNSLAQSVVQVNGSLAVLGALSADTIRARRFVSAGGMADGPSMLAYFIEPDLGSGNVGSAETTITESQFIIKANELYTDGLGIHIRAWGLFAANTNAKTIRVYIGSAKWTVITSSANVANNRWTCDIYIERYGNTDGGMSGLFTKDAASGGAPTVGHHVGQGATGAITYTNDNLFKFTLQGTSNNDVQLYGLHVNWLK